MERPALAAAMKRLRLKGKMPFFNPHVLWRGGAMTTERRYRLLDRQIEIQHKIPSVFRMGSFVPEANKGKWLKAKEPKKTSLVKAVTRSVEERAT